MQPGNVKKIYLAAPFFNEKEIENVEYAEKVLQEKGLSFFSPISLESVTRLCLPANAMTLGSAPGRMSLMSTVP